MDRERRIELEIKAATEIAGLYIAENGRFFGDHIRRWDSDIPYDAAKVAHEIVDHVLSNNRDNLCITEDDLRLDE